MVLANLCKPQWHYSTGVSSPQCTQTLLLWTSI